MLGICVVYLSLDDLGDFLQQKSIDQIACHTRSPYRIYGSALRTSKDQEDALKRAGVICVPAGNGSGPARQQQDEHSYLLDKLVFHAFEDGCDFVATFDMDSWPVLPRWDEHYISRLSGEVPLVTIVRTELGDNFPFGGFSLLSRSFWQEKLWSFGADPSTSFSSRPSETGSGLLDRLVREDKAFLRLERSNAWDPHPLMGGLYDDAVFHLGAGSRMPRFICDREYYSLNGSPARRRHADAMNEAARRSILSGLSIGYDHFIEQLAGGRLTPFEPILTPARGIERAFTHTPRSARVPCATLADLSVLRFD
ncbi:MAG: hypothetical protein ACT4SY_14065 [Hyphomicrobiales bacterium]